MMNPGGLAWSGALWLVLLLPLIVLAGLVLARALLPRSPDASTAPPSADELRASFAHGEIDEEEFLRRRSALVRAQRHRGGRTS